jgi:hypothetical protein
MMLFVVIWIAWIVAFLVAEGIAVRTGTDRAIPFTTVVRWYMRRGKLATLSVFVLWLWIGFHFFVQR